MKVISFERPRSPRVHRSVAILGSLGLALLNLLPNPTRAQDSPVIDGVLFLPGSGALYAPASEVSAALGLPLRSEPGAGRLLLGEWEIAREDRRRHPDGALLLRVRALGELPQAGITVTWDAEQKRVHAACPTGDAWILSGRRTVAEGVTYADPPAQLYVPLSELRQALVPAGDPGDETAWGPSAGDRRCLFNGAPVVPVGNPGHRAVRLAQGGQELWVTRGPKRVAIHLGEQRLRAWEGERLVMETRVCTGKPGMETPQGTFRAGPLKARLLISRKYGNAEMPWSVQVYRDVCIHGYPSVPPRPASHGCIRMPLTGRNAARWFYEWIIVGTPIRIAGDWPDAGNPELEERP